MRKTLRDYQQKMFDEVIKSDKHTLVVAPCGAGKSVVMSELVDYYSQQGKQVLFMVHRNNLIEQFGEHLSHYKNIHCDVLTPQRAKNSLKDYNIIFVDETHHATAKGFEDVFRKYHKARRIGFTATPIRLSGERLANPINKYRTTPFERVVNVITIQELINRGFLAPFEIKALDWTLFFDKKQITTLAGEYSAKSIATAFRDEELPKTVEKFKSLAENRKVIAYVSSIDMADRLVEELNKQGMNARSFHSRMSKNEVSENIELFKKNKIKVCVNVDLFGEGFDVPDCDCVLMLRPTKSLSLYIQQFMRCMRTDPNNPHKKALIIDFANNTKTHGGLITAELRMKLSQESELLRRCPVCETLNYAKSKKCDNPDCGFTFESIHKSPMKLAEEQPQELVKAVKSVVVDYGLEDEKKAIAKINWRLITDITTKYIYFLTITELSSKDKKIERIFKEFTKVPLYNGITEVKPDMDIIELACEQLSYHKPSIEKFRGWYQNYQLWLKQQQKKQRRELSDMKKLAEYYAKMCQRPNVSPLKKQEYREWLSDYKQRVEEFNKKVKQKS